MEETQPILHPLPLKSSHEKKRLPSRRTCFSACAILLGCLGLVVLAALGYLVKEFVHVMLNPNQDLWHKDHAARLAPGQNESFDRGIVRPLITSSTPFYVRATVWLEVTEYIREHGHLPDAIQHLPVVHMPLNTGESRSEAVLYDGIIYDTTSQSSRSAKIPLKIPIDPLVAQYSHLGPSTLRATFNVVPNGDVESEYGRLVNASTIFPRTDKILYRSPDSAIQWPRASQINDSTEPYDIPFESLSDALEHAAPSTSLLTLLPTQFRWQNASECLDTLGEYFPEATKEPFLDGARSSRRFVPRNVSSAGLQGDDCPPYLSDDGRIWLPHLRLRARIVVTMADRPFDLKLYRQRQGQRSRGLSKNSCFSALNTTCSPIRQDAPIETLLAFCPSHHHFDRDEKSCTPFVHHYSGPVVRQSQLAAARQHFFELPSSRLAYQEKHSPSDPCRTRRLPLDGAAEVFELDLEVSIASHGGLRANLGETLSVTSYPNILRNVSKSNQVYTTVMQAADIQREGLSAFVGDNPHAFGGSFLALTTLVTSIFLQMPGLPLLNILYWATRKTQTGLSLRAQWLSLLFSIASGAHSMTREHFDIVKIFFRLLMLFPSIYFRLACLLRVQVHFDRPTKSSWTFKRVGLMRKPKDKSALASHREEEQSLGWPRIIAICCFVVVFEIIARPRRIISIGAHYCTDRGAEEITESLSDSIVIGLLASMRRSALIMQLLFNIQHRRTLRSDHERGTFAGFFKITAYMELFGVLFPTVLRFFNSSALLEATLNLSEVVDLGLAAATALQAAVFPGIPQYEVDEDDSST